MFDIACPFQYSCPTGTMTPGPCPSYGGLLKVDGMQAVYCRQSTNGIEVACPNCGEVTSFKIDSNSALQNWICASCRYYSLSEIMSTAIRVPKSGIAKKVRCICGRVAFVITPAIPDLSSVQWACPSCHEICIISDIIERT